MSSSAALQDAPPHTHAASRPLRRILRRRAAALLRVPLFYKLCLANGAVTALAGAAVLGAAAALSGGLTEEMVAPLITFGALVIAGGAALNAILVRLALSPLERLERTAERVRRGCLDARARVSPLADRPLASLTRTFNQMLDSVQASRDRERDLATRVLGSEERERDRLARELYGGASQTLAGVLVRLQLAARRLDAEPSSLAGIREEVAHGLDEIREVARRLRPPELDELGVLPALESHARKLTEERGVRVAFEGNLPQARLDESVRLALFRIVQEAVSNAVLHSGAAAVTVSFVPRPEGLRVDVADTGRGFDATAAMSAPEGNVGILGMRERAVYAGGALRIESSRKSGTMVRAVLPWSQKGVEEGERPARRGSCGLRQGGFSKAMP